MGWVGKGEVREKLQNLDLRVKEEGESRLLEPLSSLDANEEREAGFLSLTLSLKGRGGWERREGENVFFV